MESKQEKFKRLGESRVNKIIKQVELLGNLANTSAYEYTEEQVKSIYKTIRRALKNSESNFDKVFSASKKIVL
jgi:hypothetical protein